MKHPNIKVPFKISKSSIKRLKKLGSIRFVPFDRADQRYESIAYYSNSVYIYDRREGKYRLLEEHPLFKHYSRMRAVQNLEE